MMTLKWGSFSFPLASCEVQIARKRMLTEAQTQWAEENLYTIRGKFQTQETVAATAIAALKAKVDAMETAFAQDGKDLILFFGSTRTHVQLKNADCIGGTVVAEPPNFPEGSGVQLLTMRDFTIVVRGLKRVSNAAMKTDIKSFEETLAFAPAGRKMGHLETKVGLPVRQILRRAQTYRASQRGSAVGLFEYPVIPDPVWPNALVNFRPLLTKGSPRRIGDDLIDFPIAWEYQYESAFVLNGNPHQWGVNWP